MTSQPSVDSNLKFLFRLLPVLGALCILGGMGYAVYHTSFDAASYTTVGIGLLLFLTLFLKAELSNLKYYIHLLIYSGLVLGIVVVGYLFARQYTQKVDLTKQKMYSLSEQSRNYLKRLSKEVTITVTMADPGPFKQLTELYAGNEKVKWEFIDPRKQRTRALQLGENVRANEIIFKSGKNTKRIGLTELGSNYESVITNSIIEVTRETKPKLYFTSGHGELAWENNAAAGPRQQPEAPEPNLSPLRKRLNDRGMLTEQLELARLGRVPEDAAMVVIAGAKQDLLSGEAAALDEYLKKGGKVLAVVGVSESSSGGTLDNLKGLLGRYGITMTDNIVLDIVSEQNGMGVTNPLVMKFDETNEITKKLDSSFPLGLAREIKPTDGSPQGLTATSLMQSSPGSWTEPITQVISSGRVRMPAESALHPVSLGVAVSKPAPPQMPNMPPLADDGAKGTRLVALGSTSFLYDAMQFQAGIALITNSVNWLTAQEDLIDIQPRQLEGTPIVLNANQLRLVFALSVLLIPGALFFGGVSYSMMRRKR